MSHAPEPPVIPRRLASAGNATWNCPLAVKSVAGLPLLRSKLVLNSRRKSRAEGSCSVTGTNVVLKIKPLASVHECKTVEVAILLGMNRLFIEVECNPSFISLELTAV
nr:putative integron gene cassette protein [uncultured bacterium]